MMTGMDRGDLIVEALRARAVELDQEAQHLQFLMIREPIADETDRHMQAVVKSMIADEFRKVADAAGSLRR